ncbi:hypothetical protein JX265_010100 [Neoarthrinium moseri]|uniref:NAD-dependent epimerase/dehydratase domain-containing protein n=1 Tax=Neoarthrinium moseri TaxID=1658444 RepID=A0A9P9WEN4_9PEZI|nr:hypothetical protein JX265_010100 [Neoarthrinium moseri]
MLSFMPSEDLAFARGSLILVTGVSGMIAVHIADEALRAGFRVRGTTRSLEKGQAVTELLQSPSFDFAVVEDMAADGAFLEASEGASAIIHTASIHDFSSNLEDVRGPLVRGSMNVLKAAEATSSVKRVVFTSTTGTAANPNPGSSFHVSRNTWNQTAVDLVKNTPPEDQIKMGFDWKMQVYRVAKIETELAVWDYVEQNKSHFTVNVINPGLNFGKAMGSIGVSGSQVLSLLEGSVPRIPSLYMIDIVDDARIHVAAAIDAKVTGQRIFACDEPFNWHLVTKIIQRLLPDAELPLSDPKEPLDISTIENGLGAKLLKKWWGQPGYKGLEQSIQETVEMCLERRNGDYKRRSP